MAYTDADLAARIAALETALAREERVVQFADRSVTYTSKAEIYEALNYFKRLLTEAGASGARRKQTLGVAAKGF